MSLNPFRDALGQAGVRAFHADSPFKAEADAALDAFRAQTEDLRKQVARGDATPKVARQRAGEVADRLRANLLKRSDGYSAIPRPFLDRLIEASNARKRARETMGLEGLQRETNRLLREGLVEQQLTTRAGEFEGRAFTRSVRGGPPAPTLPDLLAFHESAVQAGDEPAQEWARRQLEGFRTRVADPEDQARIDRACDRPDRVNPRIVASYVESMQERDPADLETFVAHALEGRDASACTAAFLLARQAPEGLSLRWVRSTLNGLGEFPDAALASLRTWEVDSRREESDAARAHADYAGEVARAEARLPDLTTPSAADLDRLERLEALPVAAPGEPIGLAMDRRGLDPEEYQSQYSIALD
jgi:hypothetical protein